MTEKTVNTNTAPAQAGAYLVHQARRRARYALVFFVLIAAFCLITVLNINIGNIPIGPIVATVYQVPVVIGAALLGVGAGCILGGAWGVFCFWLALSPLRRWSCRASPAPRFC